ncbi:Demethylmenaquinone methyltransferase [Fundidesulfovibrio magnetotacticus]|uniref:Demethylmenaquinone methyltransferase n=1 Tax=Fundidesulfovibrio magnetotacticus TaxID=2730080 RepID=A0A6V8LPF1_9BACT|nr:bifunctional demethylmenaquinone methyltransferase/2-methoxy-6-polyprenyl-1,4-benzoquinol methylase UbiE [Fundidesulfovibrio magnetotacticus]GFK93604.1 Demethylmenaquinone methyltransferase [Fundidesulfovibrio magnetotacticus]
MRDFEVRRMFDTIAGGYDMQNSVLSLRIDVLWRKRLARMLPADRPITVADVAAGTAEVSLEIVRQRPLSRVVGIDFTPAMLRVGHAKLARREPRGRVRLAAGDARRLPLRDASVDAVTIAFGIRNVQERAAALGEFFRVLKPGGRLLVLEFSLPDNALLRGLYRFYFDRVLPPFGNWLSRTDYAYSYLMESVHAFPDHQTFAAEIRDAGFADVDQTPLTGGIARIHSGVRPA